MTAASPTGPLPPPGTGEPGALVDVALLQDYGRFAWGALRRHPVRAFLTFALVTGCTGLAMWALPRSYHVESKVLAQSNQVMTALDNPGRSVPGDADSPTRSASETVLQRANLTALVRQTNLLEQWSATRAPAVRLKDAVMRWVAGKPTDEDRLDALVGLLEKRLQVTTPERAIVIEIDWPDAQMAYQLVEAAQQNFLETRHLMEVSAISESIAILETHTDTARSNVDVAAEDLRGARDAQSRQRAPLTGVVDPSPPRRSRPAALRLSEPDPEAEQLRRMLLAKHDAIRDLEEFRRRRLGELQSQLTEALGTFAPAHPAVLTLKTTMEQMGHDSPQLTTLRQEEQQLLAAFIRKGGRDPDLPVAAAPSPPPRPEGTLDLHRARPPVPPPVPTPGAFTTEVVSSSADDVGLDEDRLRMASLKYDDLLGRLESARIELDTARAAFKYRYSVVTPPQVPKRATKPNLPLTAVGGLLGGLLLAIFVAVVADLRAGKIVERWQVARELGVPILGHVDRL